MNVRAITVLLVSAFALTLAGCASQGTGSSTASAAAGSSANAEKISEQQRKISMLESELRNKDRQVASLASDLEQVRTSAGTAGSGSATSGIGSDLFPPNPRPGECYARVIIPAQYETSTKRVLKREASERIEVIPAKYEMAEERVLIKEASTRLETIPAQYETVTERVLVKPAGEKLEIVPAEYRTVTERVLVSPASQRIVEVPAEYKTVTERVLDSPARTEWKRSIGQGSGAGVGSGGAAAQVQRFGDTEYKVLTTRTEDTGEVMCLVEIPATYKSIQKTVLVKPATTRTIEVPAEYKTIEKRVLAKPAATRSIPIAPVYKTVEVTKLVRPETTREVTIPAEYGTVKVKKLVSPASERRIAIPEEYETVTLTQRVSEESLQWRPVLCEVNMTAQNVSALQAALQKTGCCRCGPNRNECRVDGIIGPCTLQAARCYANQKGLPSGEKYITMEIIRSLGLKF